jgi:hypothetical protein
MVKLKGVGVSSDYGGVTFSVRLRGGSVDALS